MKTGQILRGRTRTAMLHRAVRTGILIMPGKLRMRGHVRIRGVLVDYQIQAHFSRTLALDIGDAPRSNGLNAYKSSAVRDVFNALLEAGFRPTKDTRNRVADHA